MSFLVFLMVIRKNVVTSYWLPYVLRIKKNVAYMCLENKKEKEKKDLLSYMEDFLELPDHPEDDQEA